MQVIVLIVLTLLYWLWESQAEGNIRVDLLIIYPILLTLYIFLLWRKFRFYSILMALFLMALNILFFVFSYDVFDKYSG